MWGMGNDGKKKRPAVTIRSGSDTDSPDDATPRHAPPRSSGGPRSSSRQAQTQQPQSCRASTSTSTSASGSGQAQTQAKPSPRKRSRGVPEPSTQPEFVIVEDTTTDDDDDEEDEDDSGDDRQKLTRARGTNLTESEDGGTSQNTTTRRGTNRTKLRSSSCAQPRSNAPNPTGTSLSRPITPGKRIDITLTEAKIDATHLPTVVASEQPSFLLPLECKLSLEPSDPSPARRKKMLRFQHQSIQDQLGAGAESAIQEGLVHILPVQRRVAHVTFEKRWPHVIARLDIDLAGSKFALDLYDPVKGAWLPLGEAVLASETHNGWVQVVWRVVDLLSDSNEENRPKATDDRLRERLENELAAAHIEIRREIARRHLQLARADTDRHSLRGANEPWFDFEPKPESVFKTAQPIPLTKFIYDPPPPFAHTSFLSHAMPTDLSPFEVIPPWNCIARPSADLTEKEVNPLIAEVIAEYTRARPEDTCEPVLMASWVKAMIFNENNFERVDPLRLRRDFQALKGVMQELGSDADEVAQVPGSQGTLHNRHFRAEDDPDVGPKLARVVDLFKERLGITPWELQSHVSQLIKLFLSAPPIVEICELCGAISCRVHEWFVVAPNIPTANSARPRLERPEEDAMTIDCGTNCHKRPDSHVQIEHHEHCETTAAELATFKRYLDEQPRVPSCILASIAKKKCYEVEGIRRRLLETDGPVAPEPKPARQPLEKLRSRPLSVGNTRGYEPCSCEGPCQGTTTTSATAPGAGRKPPKQDKTTCECVKSGTWCDRFCGCHELCARRFPGCLCRLSPTFVRCTLADCECLQERRECDPHLCARFDGPDAASGTNDQIRYKKFKHTAIVRSTLPGAGFGVELLEDACAGDLIGIYGGEMFDVEEAPALIRHTLQEGARAGYWFDVDTLHVIDPLASGNHMRYINDLTTWNCEARWVYIDGTHQMGFCALADLKKGDEISLDYGPKYWLNVGSLAKKTANASKKQDGEEKEKSDVVPMEDA
ncbi:BQ2448_4716 [Microbotryum intermedium]|uniref:BQ2448_4716 protein n=1 Tax=Microbotryum intermedium TaxID=269621 RepID=A0A238FDX2_9BASI|nr:BQ2448_4716 [Microbotryum intermedium]